MDFSANFNSKRAALDEETGGKYREFLQSLTPRYCLVWRDIAFGYAMLALTLYAVQLFQSGFWWLLSVPLGALLAGYWVAYLQLFLHEAAHFNLCRDKKLNDRLCDIFISWQVGTSAAEYRPTHLLHHLRLGMPDDTEPSYFHAFTPRMAVEMLTGVHALRVFRRRRKAGAGKSPVPLVCGVFAHLAIIAALLAAGAWSSALAWVGGMGAFFPFFATLRQMLEHREPGAARTGEGVTRLFGDGLFAGTFGGAGFNRHLLHHWEPGVSCTRLREFEEYMMTTSMAPVIRERGTTYPRAFMRLLKADNGGAANG